MLWQGRWRIIRRAASRQFVGASVDSGAFSFYGINQTVDGILDRRALGTEWRYFEGKDTAYALLDYDAAIQGGERRAVHGNSGGLQCVGELTWLITANLLR